MKVSKGITPNSRYGAQSTSLGTLSKSTNVSVSRKNMRGGNSGRNQMKLTANLIFIKDFLNDMIKHSAGIGEFHIIHRKNQKKYENRIVKKEINLINADNQFNGALLPNSNGTWRFISHSLNKILSIDPRGVLTSYSFDCKQRQSYNLTNFFEKDCFIISCELFESVLTAESKIILLYDNFNFCYIDLIKLLAQQNERSNELITLFDAKSSYINLKPYLNIPDIDSYQPDLNNKIKIIFFPHCLEESDHDIILNFTQIANKLLVVNIESLCVVQNLIINPECY